MISETWLDMVVKTLFFSQEGNEAIRPKAVYLPKNGHSTQWCKSYVSCLQWEGSCHDFPDNLIFAAKIYFLFAASKYPFGHQQIRE